MGDGADMARENAEAEWLERTADFPPLVALSIWEGGTFDFGPVCQGVGGACIEGGTDEYPTIEYKQCVKCKGNGWVVADKDEAKL